MSPTQQQPTHQDFTQQALLILDKYGKGSIYSKPGKKDQIQFSYDDETGKKRRKSLSIPPGTDPQQLKLEFICSVLEKKYQLQLERQKRQQLQNSLPKEFIEKLDKVVDSIPDSIQTKTNCKKTVSKVIDEYIQYMKERNIAYCTEIAYKTFGNRIKELIGTKRINEITGNDFQYLLNSIKNSKTDEVISKTYLKGISSFFKRTLKYAKKQKYIKSYTDIIEDIESPLNLKEYDSDNKFLDYPELGKVLYYYQKSYLFYILRIMSITGMRAQELLALKMEDLHPDKNYIKVERALKRAKKAANKGRGFEVGTTKTKSSIRTVPTIAEVFELIDEWIGHTIENGARRLAQEKGNGDYIFINSNGDIYDRVFIGIDIWKMQKDKPSIPKVSLHMMRHCYATYLDREGCDLRLIQQSLGHNTKRGSVTEIHYIAKANNHVERVLPYLKIINNKIEIEIAKEESKYIFNRIKHS